MKPVLLLALLLLGVTLFSLGEKPFVTYPEQTGAYLKRTQKGAQEYAYDRAKELKDWQDEARSALVELIGLKQMAGELREFEPVVTEGKSEVVENSFRRTRYSIETEPGVKIPFYLLVPLNEKPGRLPLLLSPHGHDVQGFHSYAGAYQDEAHRKKILEREGNIAEQAARRGFVALAPATRGLATEVLLPDVKGRHGNRPCRAQFMHCLVSGRTPTAERVWDMQRILDWVLKHPRVDASKVVMTGNSGGGVLTAYTAAIDERITVAIPSCSFTSMTSSEGFIFHCDCCMVPGFRNWGDWRELGGLVAGRHLLLVHGVKDGLHKRADVEKLAASIEPIFKAANSPERFALKWGEGGHRFYPQFMWPFIEAALK